MVVEQELAVKEIMVVMVTKPLDLQILMLAVVVVQLAGIVTGKHAIVTGKQIGRAHV